MCALYTLRTSVAEMLSSLDFEVSLTFDQKDFNDRFLPHQKAPVIRWQKDEFRLEAMNFSLIPNWSKERRPKFATHNARLETLKEKPTWKKPLVNQHVLVPITEFIEPIYEGEHNGHMVCFSQTENRLLWAAGLWDEWLDPSTGELIPSFTIITHEPSDFVRGIGHDREPLFMAQKTFSPWLKLQLAPELSLPSDLKGLARGAQAWTDYLRRAHAEPELKIRQDRKLKSKGRASPD